MRPRPDAAENARRQGRPLLRVQGFNEAAARCRGKQTPEALRRVPCRGFNEAAARCRGKHRLDGRVLLGHDVASMRPRPDAAENDAVDGVAGAAGGRFNEAAARCRGKHRPRRHGEPSSQASMRPRPDAAENWVMTVYLDRAAAASMRPRPDAAENGAGTAAGRRPRARFNEAAARCRGKPTVRVRVALPPPPASMRPRPDAAENARPTPGVAPARQSLQ